MHRGKRNIRAHERKCRKKFLQWSNRPSADFFWEHNYARELNQVSVQTADSDGQKTSDQIRPAPGYLKRVKKKEKLTYGDISGKRAYLFNVSLKLLCNTSH